METSGSATAAGGGLFLDYRLLLLVYLPSIAIESVLLRWKTVVQKNEANVYVP